MKKILFICLGNICRSVAAEHVFRSMVEKAGKTEEFFVDSAGLIDYHEGELADARMRRHAAKRGYQLTHRSRPVTKDDFSRFDLILAMDNDNVRRLHRMSFGENFDKVTMLSAYLVHHNDDFIPDPYYGGDAQFEQVLDLLEDACAELLRRECEAR